MVKWFGTSLRSRDRIRAVLSISRLRAAASSIGSTSPLNARAKTPLTMPSSRRSKRCSGRTPPPPRSVRRSLVHLSCGHTGYDDRSYREVRPNPQCEAPGQPVLLFLLVVRRCSERQRAGGGIGRRARFRSVCPKGRGGSTPPSRTEKVPVDTGTFALSGGVPAHTLVRSQERGSSTARVR